MQALGTQLRVLVLYGEMIMEEKLYIPIGVKPEAEFFRGFGRKQLIQAAIGIVTFGIVAGVLWLATRNVIAAMITALSGCAASIMMTAKDENGLSVVDQIYCMVRFFRSQKVYLYHYGDE